MSFEKFRILLWKNWTIKKRHWKGGILELFFPVIVIILFTWLRIEYMRDEQTSEAKFDENNPNLYKNCMDTWTGDVFSISYSPSSPWVDSFIQTVMNAEGLYKVEKFANAQALDLRLYSSESSESIIGIEFEDSLTGSPDPPKVLKYTLRFPNRYYDLVTFCYSSVQNQLEEGFINNLVTTNLPPISLNGFYYLQSIEDVLPAVFKFLLPLVLVLTTFYTANNIIKNVALERESQLKETMRVMGLSNTIHWTAWLTTCYIILFVAYTLVTIFMGFGIIGGFGFFAQSNIFLVWLFFMFYSFAVITFCFLVSVIFKKSSTASNIGTIAFILTFMPYFQYSNNFESFNYIVKFLFCLPVNTGLGQGIAMILDLEQQRVGLNFSNFASRSESYGFSVMEVMIAFLVAGFIQMLIMLYIEQVFTGGIGVARPWYFPVAPIIRVVNKKPLESNFVAKQKQAISTRDFEQDPVNMKAGIRISEMTKMYGKSTVVNQLNLNMYEDQITVLLGHNGAGKSTTISMLTGMFSPTSGTAFLDGFDITTETVQARSSLGLCPQHNVLIDDLSVAEHIIFFCRLKGVSSDKLIQAEIEKYSDLLDMNGKVNALSKTLSGGQKRKLAIGVALCGDSKIVMLDEPTSGLDAGARRSLWNLLIAEKKGRTILLTTHHMDEADVLGDRIAIMNEGELQTVGSSYFLKKRFGSGYKLICVKKEGFREDEILNELRAFDPLAQIESNDQTEAVFLINEDYLPVFHNMFKRIEHNSERLKISSFGCSMTSLEEVFIKVGAQDSKGQHGLFNFKDIIPSRKVIGVTLFFYQVYAMVLKKFHFTRRNFYSIGWLIVISAALLYIFLASPIEFDSIYDSDRFDASSISLNNFRSTITAMEAVDSKKNIADSYSSLFKGKDEILVINEPFMDFIFTQFQINVLNVYEKFMIGVTITDEKIVAWFNYFNLSSFLQCVTLNYVHRAILKSAVGSEYDILAFNRPFTAAWMEVETTQRPTTTTEAGDAEIVLTPEEELSFTAMLTNFILIFMLFYLLLIYWPSIFVAIKVKERVTRAKLLQFISGANRFIYWFTSYLVDYIFFMVIMFTIVGIVALNQRAYFRTGEQLGTLMAVFSFYGAATLPFIYTISFVFDKHSTAESIIRIYGLLCGVLYIAYQLVNLLDYKTVGSIIYWIGLLFGPFSVLDCFRKIAFGTFDEEYLDEYGNVFNFGKYGIYPNIIMMIASACFFLSICLLKDFLIFEKMFYKCSSNKFFTSSKSPNMDEDVSTEMDKIKKMSPSQLRDSNLVLNGLSKTYKSNVAVNQLFLGIESAECFGLLGINGAGKTSTFKMMTGDELISGGDAWIRGNSMKNNMIKAQKAIGYCPQFDALMFEISGRESMKIFALIRGIPLDEIDGIIQRLSTELGFQMHLDKKVKAYSGGNKRKLSTALSLLGNPNLIFLDEPTTGIDPYSKRQLWNIINKTRNSGKSVVLTTHSMSECEALCTRIAIMVAGEFKCLGSAQHLKNKFAKGFVLSIKMTSDDDASMHQIQNKIHATFQNVHLKERYMDLLTFHIASVSLKWSEIFSTMTHMKASASTIDDFTITQMSLEQVFLHFTREGQSEVLSQSGNESILI